MGKIPPMPDITGGEYLLGHLSELGWCTSNGMGIQPLSFTEIKNYIDLCDVSLTSDEALILRKMSQAYVRESQNRDPQAKVPFSL